MTVLRQQAARKFGSRFVLWAILVVPVLPAAAQEPTAAERFQLYAGCSPVLIGYVDIQDADAELGLSEGRVETLVRSRLRGARIYYSGPITTTSDVPVLTTTVYVSGQAFHIEIGMLNRVSRTSINATGIAWTWSRHITGTHGKNPSFVLGAVSEVVDIFIDEYLRVNEAACSEE